MITIKECACGNRCEGRTDACASCNAAVRKAERRKLTVKKPIKKFSDKKRNELDQYAVLREAFLLRKWCCVHGKPCIPTQVHHAAGKVGFIDDWARENNIPALIDIRYFKPICDEAHREVTENSAWAIEQGYSFLRTEIKMNHGR